MHTEYSLRRKKKKTKIVTLFITEYLAVVYAVRMYSY